MSDNDDEGTPARREPPAGYDSDRQADIASTGIALATVATRLRHQADLADGAAERCREAARMGEDFSSDDRGGALAAIEEGLGTLAEAIHDARRALRDSRMELKKERR